MKYLQITCGGTQQKPAGSFGSWQPKKMERKTEEPLRASDWLVLLSRCFDIFFPASLNGLQMLFWSKSEKVISTVCINSDPWALSVMGEKKKKKKLFWRVNHHFQAVALCI